MLTGEEVKKVVLACLFQEGEEIKDAVIVEGIIAHLGFHPQRLAAHKPQIVEFLRELPDEFFANKGGGWSFLNLCHTKDGRLWTGEHRKMDELCCLAIASGLGSWCMPRPMWEMLPGGMPYVTFDLDGVPPG